MISRSRPHSRRGFTCVWLQLVFGSAQIATTGTGAYLIFRGDREWREAQKQVVSAGYTLDMLEISRGPVPDAENFGATPALRGLVARTADQTPEIKAKLERLKTLDPAPSSALRTAVKDKPDTGLGKPRDWKVWRHWLKERMQWNVPEDTEDDAAAVLAALQTRDESLMTELRAAATRPRFTLLPTESSRLAASILAKEYNPEVTPLTAAMMPLSRFLSLRLDAALHCGRRDEVEKLLPVMTALVRLSGSDSNVLAMLVGHTLEQQFFGAVRTGISANRMSAAELEQCQRFLETRNSASMLKTALSMELAQICHAYDVLLERGGDLTAFESDPSEAPPSFSPIVNRLIGPANQAAMVNTFLDNAALLEKGDWPGLMAAHARRKELQRTTPLLLQFRTLLADGAAVGYGALFAKFVHVEMHRRMLVAGCALQRRRLEGQELPDTLADLPRRLLSAVPRDIDGQPVRYHPTPQGFVVWSVGENLRDDWKGAPPPDDARDQELRDQADWQLRGP